MASFFERRLLNHARCINPAKIRQIIATYGMKYLDEREEKTLARTMLHSTEVHQRYYTKQSGGELFESGRIVLRKIISKETGKKENTKKPIVLVYKWKVVNKKKIEKTYYNELF